MLLNIALYFGILATGLATGKNAHYFTIKMCHAIIKVWLE